MRLLEVNRRLSRETSVKPNCLALRADIHFRPTSQRFGESVRQPIHGYKYVLSAFFGEVCNAGG